MGRKHVLLVPVRGVHTCERAVWARGEKVAVEVHDCGDSATASAAGGVDRDARWWVGGAGAACSLWGGLHGHGMLTGVTSNSMTFSF